MPTARWRSQLARRTTVLHRKKKASRRCSGLPWCVRRSQPACHGAPAASSLFRHLPRDSHRSGDRSRATGMPGARWRSQLARRTTVLHKQKEAFPRCSAFLSCVGRSHPARHGARTRHVRVFCHLSRDSQRSGDRSRATRVLAARWRSQLARHTTVLHRKREACHRHDPFIPCRLIATSAAWRARAANLCVSPPPERQPADCARVHATRKPAAHWRPQLARRITILHRRREVFRRCSALCYVCRSSPTRHGARAAARVLHHLPRDSHRSGARSRATGMPAECWRSQLSRRTTVLHRKKEASRRCSALA